MNGGLPSFLPFSTDPGSVQCLTKLIEEDLSTFELINCIKTSTVRDEIDFVVLVETIFSNFHF